MTDHFKGHGHIDENSMYVCDLDLRHVHTTKMTMGNTNTIPDF